MGEHSTIIDQNWEVTKVQNDPQPFSMVSSVPLEDCTFSENPINVATDIPNTENGGINDKTDAMVLAPNIAIQPVIHKKGQKDKTSDYAASHHVSKTVINPPAKEITTSGTEANAFLSKDKAIVEDESYISEAEIPVNLREVNSVNIDPFILKPDVLPDEQKAHETLKETFYPDSTTSTTKLTKPRAKGSFSLDNEKSERSTTNSYNTLYHLPPLSPTDFVADFIKTHNSEFDPALSIEESDIKMIDESITSDDIIVLPDKEIISPDSIISIDNTRNIINGKNICRFCRKIS